MFLRTVKAAGGQGVQHEYVRLVEAYREDGRAKQRVVCNLGRKDLLAAHLDALIRLLRGEPVRRAAVRLGKQVTWVSPEVLEDKKVIPEESVYAAQEGVHIEALVKPLEIVGNDRYFARAVKCARLDYADTRATGHWELTPVPNSDFVIEADSVIIAMGHTPNSLIKRDVPQLKVNDDGTIWIGPSDSTTSMRGVFACGNAVTNATAAVEAMASGKKAAADIDNYLQKK